MKQFALYDLSERPATFDIVTFLAIAKTIGLTNVRFVYGSWKPKNYTMAQAEERFRSICVPAVDLYGMTWDIGAREGMQVTHFVNGMIGLYNKHHVIKKIAYPVEPKDYITITKRNSRNPTRNTKDDEWDEFAKTVNRKVVVLPDYEDQPISLMDRMKLYAGAEMNLFVSNGPLTLCVFSEAPYLCMRTIGKEEDPNNSPRWMKKVLGIEPGFQYPWANSRQRLSYLDDTAENIHKEFNSMCEKQRMVA